MKRVGIYTVIIIAVVNICVPRYAEAYTYSCVGVGCSIDGGGCSANPYTGQSGCGCSYNGSEVVCTQPNTNQAGGQAQSSPASASPSIQNPLAVGSICGLIKLLLNAALQIGIPIAVLFIVYAGLRFVLAQGKPEDLAKARTNMLWTVIGIGIFLSAWLLSEVIANTVNSVRASDDGVNLTSCN